MAEARLARLKGETANIVPFPVQRKRMAFGADQNFF